MYNYPFKFGPAECFCCATKQTYYNAVANPETIQNLRWSSLQQLRTAKNR